MKQKEVNKYITCLFVIFTNSERLFVKSKFGYMYNLKMQATSSSEKFLSLYLAMRCHIPEEGKIRPSVRLTARGMGIG